MKIGVLGGTFDPVHLGHLIVAEEVRMRLSLAEVLFVPARQSPLKLSRPLSRATDRVAMLDLAIGSNPGFRISRVDLDRPPPSYSVETLTELRRTLDPQAEIFFIMGADSVAELPTWRHPERILQLCQVVGVSRPGFEHFDPAALDPLIRGASGKILMLDVPGIGISSTAIRARLSLGQSIRYLVPNAVREYICAHGLYGVRAAVEG